MTDRLLDISDLVCQRGGAEGFALAIDALSVHRGEAVGITGPSGSGKSTLLDVVGLVLRPSRPGRFTLAGSDVAALWAGGRQTDLARLRAQSIGYVLQTGGLLPFITVLDNIRLSRDLLGLPADPNGEKRLIDALGLGGLLHKKPAMLSIGERQRVAIARALAHRPPLVLADEPTASLDPTHAAAVMHLLLALAAELGLGVVVVSHDWDLLSRFGLRRVEAQPGGNQTRFAG
ncbi:putative ABC transport system, ATP-binding protein [Magnetospirillum gryphiswaldense MSR-1 v2]|uniref:ABC transport system, ATP-binding protein n=1 Tax=Magnetospirillum gryphiswaldense (strain DSM 6361 / JCM 21280 / NBRC 15271 / MSR-1) TaxID=431944 RepID=V6EVX9_MAGGM|nr:ATP-binding cassette domain-containing protein [Magnetospirillum gryphiswaldense]CDK97430.1 putative ABC transport system, ATP-binding protein [Magnetospirillum gryphiswaldense MSR-1 v2]